MIRHTDLHRHLDGSLRRSTLMELADSIGLEIPETLGFEPGMGLAAALECFKHTLSVLQTPENVKRVASEICEDAAKERIDTLEIRFAPQLHQGASPRDILDAAIEGVAGRASLILCGLYGEPPEVLQHLVDLAVSRGDVVGIDLAGGSDPSHRWQLIDYRGSFERAAIFGLGRTVHAGEAGRGPEEIRVAIEELCAQRIGHGVTLMDDPAVVDLVIKNNVTMEVCLTSNVHTGSIKATSHHPLPKWLKAGVRACICTDNTMLSRTTLKEELVDAFHLPGMTQELFDQLIVYGQQAAFVRGGI